MWVLDGERVVSRVSHFKDGIIMDPVKVETIVKWKWAKNILKSVISWV